MRMSWLGCLEDFLLRSNNLSMPDPTLKEVSTEPRWKVALVFSPGQNYHWYRQDENGNWSHKPGQGPVQNTDYKNKKIQDPEKADWGIYTIFVGYFEVGN